MRGAGVSFCVALALGCGGSAPAPGAPQPGAPSASASPGLPIASDDASCDALRAQANAAHAEGRLDSTVRLIAEADARCPATAAKSAALLATTRSELRPGGDGHAILAAAYQALAAGRAAEARAGFSRALAALEAQHDARVSVGLPESGYTDLIEHAADVVAFGRDNTILVHDARTMAPRLRLVNPTATDRAYLHGLAISQDGSRLAAAWGNSFVVWDLRTGKLARSFDGHPKAISGLAFSGDGRIVLSASEDKTIRAWEVDTGKVLRSMPHADGLSAMTVSPKGDLVVGAPFRGPMLVWNIASGQQVRSIASPKAQVVRLTFSADGRTLAASVSDSPSAGIHLYDAATGQERRAFALLEHASFSPDGKLLAGSHEAGMKVIDLARGVPIVERKTVQNPHFMPDGSLLALDEEGGVLQLDPRTGNGKTVLPSPRAATQVLFGLASRIVVKTRSGIELCDLSPKLDCRELGGKFRSVGYDAKNTTLAVLRDDDGSVDVLDAQLQKRKNLLGHADTHLIPQHNAHLVLSRDGKRAATVEYEIHVLDLEAGLEMKVSKMEGHNGLAMSADGKRLATPRGYNSAVYETDTGALVADLKGHTAGVTALAFSEDGRLLASGGGDKTIRIFDIASKTNTQTTQIETEKHGAINALAFSPDGRHLLAGCGRKARIFDVDGLRPVATLEGHALPIFGVAYRNDSRVAATASTDGLLRLWSAEGKLLTSIGFLEGDSAYALSPDHEHIEPYGNARKWLTCDLGSLSFPFDLCEDRVTTPSLAATQTR